MQRVPRILMGIILLASIPSTGFCQANEVFVIKDSVDLKAYPDTLEEGEAAGARINNVHVTGRRIVMLVETGKGYYQPVE